MKASLTAAVLALAVVSFGAGAPAVAQSCVDKGGRGTGSTTDDARFQAWEAVLQATDWGMWAAWMASGAKVKQAASGYKVSNIRERCYNGGSMGKECIIRAKLCK